MPPAVPPGLPSDLLQRRPDIMKAEQDLAAAIGQHRRGAGGPVSSTVAHRRYVRKQSSPWIRTSSKPYATFKGQASLTGPIFNASALGYQVKAAEAQGNQAIAQYIKTILQAFQEVEDSLITVQKTREQREALEQQVEALQSALRLADLRYQGGRANYLDVLTAQRSSVRCGTVAWRARAAISWSRSFSSIRLLEEGGLLALPRQDRRPRGCAGNPPNRSNHYGEARWSVARS